MSKAIPDPVIGLIADAFEGIGCLPEEYEIQLNEDVPPADHPLRIVPVPKKEA